MTTAPLLRSAKSKPLVLLEQGASAHLLQLRQVKLPPACAGLPAAHDRPEACLVAALAGGHLDGASLLLSGFLRRRPNALWGWWCLHQTLDAIAQQRAQAAAAAGAAGGAGGAGAGGAAGGALPTAPRAAHGVALDVGVARSDFAPPPRPPGVPDLAQASSWPQPRLDDQGLTWLPPALQDDPLRPRTNAELYFARQAEFLATLPPEERAAHQTALAAGRERLAATLGGSPRAMMAELNRRRIEGADQAAERAHAPYQKLKDALAAKRGEIDARVAGARAQVEAMKAALPTLRRPAKDALAPATGEAMEAARRWIIAPDQEAARTAFAAGRACKGKEHAAGLVAMACFWSGTDLQPPEAPAEAQPIPPPPGLAPRAVATALQLASHLPDSGATPAQWQERYLAWGLEIAQGLLTVDRLLALGDHQCSPWAGKAGFGRLVAKPEPAKGETPKPDQAPAWSIRNPRSGG